MTRTSLAWRQCHDGTGAAAAAAAVAVMVEVTWRDAAQQKVADRGISQPSGARHLAAACCRHNSTDGISHCFSRVDTGVRARGFGFARACLRAHRGGGAPQPSAPALALDESATHHAVSSTAASPSPILCNIQYLQVRSTTVPRT